MMGDVLHCTFPKRYSAIAKDIARRVGYPRALMPLGYQKLAQLLQKYTNGWASGDIPFIGQRYLEFDKIPRLFLGRGNKEKAGKLELLKF